jgi:queuine tRNA-ribosyltransferase
MPVGTYGTVKAMTPEELEGLGAQIVLGNTFHLMLRPGAEIIALHRDGLHGFMGWNRPILTDSGGFQVFSLAASCGASTRTACSFRSPVDGSPGAYAPEDSMDVQRALRSDIAMAFDDCTPIRPPQQQARESMQRSMRWALRSYDHYYRDPPAGSEPPGHLFGIVQGGMFDVSCGSSRSRRCRSATGRATRSAGWRWASPRRSGCGCWSSWCRGCRRIGRAT